MECSQLATLTRSVWIGMVGFIIQSYLIVLGIIRERHVGTRMIAGISFMPRWRVD